MIPIIPYSHYDRVGGPPKQYIIWGYINGDNGKENGNYNGVI